MVGFNPYLIGGTLLAGLALTAGLLWYRAEAIDARADAAAAEAALAIARQVNEDNVKSLAELQRRADRANAETERLANELNDLRAANQAANEELEELKRNDPTVDEFLRLPVPDALQRLLDK